MTDVEILPMPADPFDGDDDPLVHIVAKDAEHLVPRLALCGKDVTLLPPAESDTPEGQTCPACRKIAVRMMRERGWL